MVGELLILPDSRLKVTKGVKVVSLNTPFGVIRLNCVPIFCINCGADGGYVPEENMTFVSYLCNDCFEKHGNIEGVYIEPDAVFWEKVKNEMLTTYGHELMEQEILQILEDESSGLSKLAKERGR